MSNNLPRFAKAPPCVLDDAVAAPLDVADAATLGELTAAAAALFAECIAAAAQQIKLLAPQKLPA